MFCYQLRISIGALTVILGCLDTLVFTGGIGEHAAPVRWDGCRDLAYLSTCLNPHLNKGHADIISTLESRCTVCVVRTNEDLMIVRYARRLLFAALPAENPSSSPWQKGGGE